MSTLKTLQSEIRKLADPELAGFQAKFFRTGKGEYGEGDKFLGLNVPKVRAIEKKHRKTVSIEAAAGLLASDWHDERLLALVILVEKFKRTDPASRTNIHRLYLKMKSRINNWDLVDVSAPVLVGQHLVERGRNPYELLLPLVRSRRLWDRRIAMLSTFAFLRAGDFGPTLRLSELLLEDKEDLMHKASGWMLREVGKRDELVLRGFLDTFAARMPRTMLRYAIERLPERDRRAYLKAGATTT